MKKLLFLLTALILIFSLLSGCTGSTAPVADKPPAQTDGQQAPADEYIDTGSSSEPTPDEPGRDNSDPADEPKERVAPSGTLKVHFIDVGQGDAILVQTATQNILIDGGDRGTTVVNYLRSKNISSLDLVIGTHPHADHIGGLINVMESILVKEVIDPGVVHTTKTLEDYLTLIDQKNITFTEGRAGMSRDIGSGATLQILHPTSPSASHLNDASVVARVTFGQVSFMLTGDAEKAAEEQILKSGKTIKSTILKVGHHGSRTSTTSSFLSAVNPKAAVIMAGANNRYGHPHQETLASLAAANVNIYRTDLHGTIVITTDGQTFDVNQKQPYQYTPQKVPEPAPPSSEPVPSAGRININTASLEELQEIVHIGADRARQLIELRPYSSLDELSRISGIGPARLADIKEEGKAYSK